MNQENISVEVFRDSYSRTISVEAAEHGIEYIAEVLPLRRCIERHGIIKCMEDNSLKDKEYGNFIAPAASGFCDECALQLDENIEEFRRNRNC